MSLPKLMPPKEKILSCLQSHSPLSGPELADRLGISRQGLNVHMQELLATGKVVKTGSTRNARYHARGKAPSSDRYARQLPLRQLDESRVYERVAISLNLRSRVPDHVESIVHYAFTEMLNNAIDHADCDRGRINVTLGAGELDFEVRDYGIGIFHSIATKFDLEDEHAAMIELIKGKTTTMPEAHSGEGIFFTSKLADRFLIQSHRTKIEWNRHLGDTFVSSCRALKGTRVRFSIRRDARQRLDEVFTVYAPEDFDFQFQKTKVQVKLLQKEYISRSEAKRLMLNLEKFREIVLDFKGVNSIGQGFADEVFRVFLNQNPDISVFVEHANSVVTAMLKHAGFEPRDP